MLDEVRVLVVDDLRDAAETMAAALALQGFDTRTAFDGAEALAVADDYRPHVVLLDVNMPGMDGCELSRLLRQRYGDDMVLIAMTGWDAGDERVATTFDRVDHYFRKPVDPAALRKVLSIA